jgi:hypothetical protein
MTTTICLCLQVHWDSVDPELSFLTSMVPTRLTSLSLTPRMMQRVIRATIRPVDSAHLEGAQRHLRPMPTTWSGGLDRLIAKFSCVQQKPAKPQAARISLLDTG